MCYNADYVLPKITIAQRTTHNAQRTTHNAQRTNPRIAKFATANARRLATITIAVATLCAFWFANNAAAQQTTVIYSVSPSDAGNVNAAGSLIVNTPSQSGDFVITVSAASVTIDSGGAILGTALVGSFTITMKILATCNINTGCDIFGIPADGNLQARINAFRDMSLQTLSMFIASGADTNENAHTVGDRAQGFLIYHLASSGRGEVERMQAISIMVAAGGNVNASIHGRAMLHAAVAENNGRALSVLLQVGGIDTNSLDENGRTPLDLAAHLYRFVPNSYPNSRDFGTALRNAGGRCILFAADTNAAIVEICSGG